MYSEGKTETSTDDVVRRFRRQPFGKVTLEGCPAEIWIRTGCLLHGHPKQTKVDCHKSDCEYCQNNWRRRWAARVAEGVRRRPNEDWHFLTLTMPGGSSVDAMLKAWRSLRKSRTWRRDLEMKGAEYARKVEVGEGGNVHLHLVISGNLPAVAKARRSGESIARYYRRQTPRARSLIRAWTKSGGGPIMDCQRVRHSVGGVAVYVAKYLSKTSRRRLSMGYGRQTRVMDTSKKWLPQRTDRPRYYKAEIAREGTEETPDCQCTIGRSDAPADTIAKLEAETESELSARNTDEGLQATISQIDRMRALAYVRRTRAAEAGNAERARAIGFTLDYYRAVGRTLSARAEDLGLTTGAIRWLKRRLDAASGPSQRGPTQWY